MELPFSHDAFLDVFGAFNLQWWPLELFLWAVTAVVSVRWLTPPGVNGRGLMVLLGFHWLWSGLAFHWAFFRALTPAAAVFAAAFVVQGLLLIWRGVDAEPDIVRPQGMRGVLAAGLVGYGLLYPAIGPALGLEYPRVPLFGVPCPSTLVTAGFLIAMPRMRRDLVVVPIAWAVIGGSAALLLGIRADLALIAAAVALAFDTASPAALGRRTTSGTIEVRLI